MEQESKWEKFYKETSLEKISWQKAQDDYLREVVGRGKIKPGKALDLGCGTGVKSVFLAQKGFDVIGVDISETAISHAEENAQKAGVEVEFVVADATDLSFLGEQKFDFVLDWANLHGIPREKQSQYVSEVTKGMNPGSKLLLRCFGRKEGEESVVSRPMGDICLFLEEEIEELYHDKFKIIERNNKSLPGGENPPGKFFFEFIMERI